MSQPGFLLRWANIFQFRLLDKNRLSIYLSIHLQYLRLWRLLLHVWTGTKMLFNLQNYVNHVNTVWMEPAKLTTSGEQLVLPHAKPGRGRVNAQIYLGSLPCDLLFWIRIFWHPDGLLLSREGRVREHLPGLETLPQELLEVLVIALYRVLDGAQWCFHAVRDCNAKKSCRSEVRTAGAYKEFVGAHPLQGRLLGSAQPGQVWSRGNDTVPAAASVICQLIYRPSSTRTTSCY